MTDILLTKRKIKEVKNLRVIIDGCIKEAKGAGDIVEICNFLHRGPGGREMSLVITKLEEAKMWAGKVLGELGEKLPEKYRDEKAD